MAGPPDILRRPSRREELLGRARAKGLAKAAEAFGGEIRSGQTLEQRNIRAGRVGVRVNRAIAQIQAEAKRGGAAISRFAATEELRKRGRAVGAAAALPGWAKGPDRLGKTIKKILTWSPGG